VGHARVRGRVGALLEIGTAFHPQLTGRENVWINGALLGMAREDIRRHFDEIVEFAGVGRFLDTPIKRYSSGMYLRLAFAIAAFLEPDVIVVDEVLAVGDAEFQKRCLGRMSALGNEGRTVLFVSHDLGAIGHLCDRVMWLDGGSITLNHILLYIHPVNPGLDDGILTHYQIFMILSFAGAIGQVDNIHAHVVGRKLLHLDVSGKADERTQYILVGPQYLGVQKGNPAIEQVSILCPGQKYLFQRSNNHGNL